MFMATYKVNMYTVRLAACGIISKIKWIESIEFAGSIL